MSMLGEREEELTRLGQVIWLLVRDAHWPPTWLRQLRVDSLRSSSHVLSSVVWVVDLLSRLNQLDPSLCNHATVQLLEVIECFFIVSSQKVVVSYAQSGASNRRAGRRRGCL